MSRNSEKECIAEVEEREDQMRTHRQEYLESIGSQMTARRVVTLQEENDRLRKALTMLLKSVPVAADSETGVNVCEYTDREWDALCIATGFARAALKEQA